MFGNSILLSVALLLVVFLVSCENSVKNSVEKEKPENPIWKILSEEFQNEEDPIYAKSIEFLRKEMPFKSSNRVRWVNPLGDTLSFHSMEVNSREQLMKLLNNRWQIIRDTVPDLEVLSRLDLSKRIRSAVKTRREYKWNQNIPDSIFLRYVLPYKIVDEYPEDWRSHYYDILSETLDTLNENLPYEPIEQVPLIKQVKLRIIQSDHFAGFWKYNADSRSFNQYPSLSELYCFHEGSCYYGVNLFNYILRSSGIPTTVDEIPFWGSVNGQHAFEIVYDPVQQRFPAEGIDGRRPAKILRRTFHREGNYTDDILKLTGNDVFPLPFLKNDYWYDATSHHWTTRAVKVSAGNVVKQKGYGLIYAMNYGRWAPIYYGKVNGDNVVFSNMGTDIIYRAGYFENGEHHFTTPPFLLTSSGELEFPDPDYTNRINIQTPKINHGELANVEEGADYTLLVVNKNGDWDTLKTKKCKKNGSLSFTDVPANGYYYLESPSDKRNLARIFKMGENGEQIWY